MSPARVLAAALVLAGCAAAPPAEPPPLAAIALQNPGFEIPPAPGALCAPRWECSAHADPGSFTYTADPAQPAAGAQSLRIERVRKEPWGLISQVVRDTSLRGARVRFSIALRTEGVTGEGAGPFVFFHDGSGRVVASAKALGKPDAWKRLSVEYVVPQATHLIEVGATLEGPGRAWIDEARLEVLERPAAAKPAG